MLKSILNLEGAQGLSKNEQKEVNGGMSPIQSCGNSKFCPDGSQPFWAEVANGCQNGYCDSGNTIISRTPR